MTEVARDGPYPYRERPGRTRSELRNAIRQDEGDRLRRSPSSVDRSQSTGAAGSRRGSPDHERCGCARPPAISRRSTLIRPSMARFGTPSGQPSARGGPGEHPVRPPEERRGQPLPRWVKAPTPTRPATPRRESPRIGRSALAAPQHDDPTTAGRVRRRLAHPIAQRVRSSAGGAPRASTSSKPGTARRARSATRACFRPPNDGDAVDLGGRFQGRSSGASRSSTEYLHVGPADCRRAGVELRERRGGLVDRGAGSRTVRSVRRSRPAVGPSRYTASAAKRATRRGTRTTRSRGRFGWTRGDECSGSSRGTTTACWAVAAGAGRREAVSTTSAPNTTVTSDARRRARCVRSSRRGVRAG